MNDIPSPIAQLLKASICLSEEEKEKLGEIILKGEDSEEKGEVQEQLLRGYLPFIVEELAKLYGWENLEDNVGIALWRVCLLTEKWDGRKGSFTTLLGENFKTELPSRISQEQQAIHIGSSVDRIKKFIEKYRKANGKEPTNEEIAEGLHLSPRTVSRQRSLPSPQVFPLESLSRKESLPNGEETWEKIIEKISVEQIISKLPPREQEIVKLRAGLDGEEPRTLQEIADRLGVSRQRVHKIIQKEIIPKLEKLLLEAKAT